MDEGTCPTRTIASWSQFVQIAAAYARPDVQFAFRGESDSRWRLTPTLIRRAPLTGARELLVAEREARRTFISEAHLHLPAEHLPVESDLHFDLEAWSLMQHFGAPTRLLDWTLSPYVATYF